MTLKLPRLELLKRPPNTPHRKRILASCVVRRKPGHMPITVELAANYGKTLFFVQSRGGGLRHSDPLITRNPVKAAEWAKAIDACDVEIPDPLA